MENSAETRPIITRAWARNFRNLDDIELNLDPMTVLVGPNASGKSNIVDVLRFVADALRTNLDAAVTARHGIGALRRWSAKGRPYDIEIGLAVELTDFSVKYEFVLGSGLHGQYKVKREYAEVMHRDLPSERFEVEVRDGTLVKPAETEKASSKLFRFAVPPTDIDFEPTSLAFPTLRRMLRFGRPSRPPNPFAIVSPLTRLHFHLVNMRFYHIFPNILREPQKLGITYPLEEHGENLLSVLREMIRTESPFLSDLKDALQKVVPGVCDVQVTQVGGYLVGRLKHLMGEDNGARALFDLSQESDGTLRLLGLLVALFQQPSPSLVAIEEPELTIHPGALAVLADLLREATGRTQVLITTHSPDLIDRLPVEHLRAVKSVGGATAVGMVAQQQREAVRQGLFSPGELHRIEGLQQAVVEK